MVSLIRRHVNAASIVAFIALIFAMTGGAMAVNSHGGPGAKASAALGSKAIVGTEAKSKAKSKGGSKGPPGPRGATGAVGPAGPAGSTGPAGPAGSAGAKGETGTTGTTGATGLTGPAGEKGRQGEKGEPGEPGTFGGGALPPEKTESGSWSVAPLATGSSAFVAFSFPAPLEAKMSGPTHIAFVTEAEANSKANANCPGNAEDPQAAVGYFCFYVGSGENLKYEGTFSPAFAQASVGTSGGFVSLGATKEPAYGSGSWAVTAPPAA